MNEMQRSADRQHLTTGGATAMFGIAARWNEELLRFYGLRMKRYLELSSRLWECKSAGDIVKVQTGFLQTMLADYRSETDLVCSQFLPAQKPGAGGQRGESPQSYEAAILKAQEDAGKIIGLAKDQAARILEEAAVRTSPKTAARSPKRQRSATA